MTSDHLPLSTELDLCWKVTAVTAKDVEKKVNWFEARKNGALNDFWEIPMMMSRP